MVLSPGQSWPADAGQMEELITVLLNKKADIKEIYLGHQAIAESIVKLRSLAHKVMHGDKQSILRFEKSLPIYKGIEDGQPVMRYR